MLTRREKLLVRPWQLRRYNNHRKKVSTALPAIDFGPPPERGHVTRKLKKLQWEGERRSKIEEDNFRLLQRMGAIMKKNRLDNHWETQPPTFLRRVGIYHRTRSPSPFEELTASSSEDTPVTRKSRCVACGPSQAKPKPVPEERIPWEPPKKSLSRRRSDCSSLPVPSDFDLPPQLNKKPSPDLGYLSRSHPVSAASRGPWGKTSGSADSGPLPSISSGPSKALAKAAPEQRFIIQQGSLQLAVDFPSDAQIKIKSGKDERIIQSSQWEYNGLGAN